MPERIIKCRPSAPGAGAACARVEDDPWRYLEDAIEGGLPRGPLAVGLATWKARREDLLRRREPVGVVLQPDDDPHDLGPDAHFLSLVAIRFPRFTDGRGYSSAVLLRRLGYRGELRAVGDVGRDQLANLRRCGFDAFALPAHRDPEAALSALDGFSVRYQGSVDDAQPLFRKRFAGGVA